MSTTGTKEHVVSVERLNQVFKHADPRIFAVVERLNSHVKVCAVSKHYGHYQVIHVLPGDSRWDALQNAASGFARSYGARYVENPHPDDEPLTNEALRRDLPGRHRAEYDLAVDVAQLTEPTSARRAAVAA